ncbi:hypothetical protein BpHYR1_019527 [Brachionus plicatilis]|uniref:Uncharacterized protein n=1 Tax=Brachionus plicatilis TaxID=10195 RepID=A0A3M7PUI4_BRAPC|nr:hypothetical protein BpHYR1_019527 [Brachionus plicatilis]
MPASLSLSLLIRSYSILLYALISVFSKPDTELDLALDAFELLFTFGVLSMWRLPGLLTESDRYLDFSNKFSIDDLTPGSLFLGMNLIP